MHVSHAIVSVA